MSSKTWFGLSPDEGLKRFETEAEARAYAVMELEYITDGGRHEDVASVCWGRVHGVAVCVEHRATPDGEYDFIERWEMQEVKR